MPDGDKVHPRLPPRYQKPYQQVCEGQFSDLELARDIVRVVKGDVESYQNEPIELIASIAARLEQLQSMPLLKENVNWGDESRALDRLAQQTEGNPRAIELALGAGKQVLHDLRHDVRVNNLRDTLHSTYILNVYQANFEGRIPLGRSAIGIDQDTVNKRVESLRPHIEREAGALAAQLSRNGRVDKLRMAPRHGEKLAVDLHTDLLSLSL